MSPLPQSAVVTGTDDEPDPADVANAIHLDQLESSDAIHDITSFQDIDIGGASTTANDKKHNDDGDAASVISDNTYDQYGRVRRPKKLYYVAPVVQKYKYWMGGCTLAVFLLLLAVGLSARSSSMATQQQQEEGRGSEEVGRGKMSVGDAPPPPMTYNDDTAIVVDETGEEILNSEEDDTTTFTVTSTSNIIEGVNWYQTTNIEYLSFLSNNAADIVGLSAVSTAKLFCKSRNDARLCTYAIYCPNGYGQLPYPNGPPTYDGRTTETTTETSSKTWSALDEQQWAPYLHPDDVGGNYWVQVGFIPPTSGGHTDNGYGQCYTAGIWHNQRVDEYDGSMEDEIDGSNRRYVLCCE